MSTNSGDPPRRLTVFLSGTYDDLEEYRLAVSRVLARADHFPLDSHHRAGNHSSLLTRIQDQILQQSHAYVGVFATRYGSLVPGHDEAISFSEYEYDIAISKWGTLPSSPLFIYRPKKGPDCVYGDIQRLSDEADRDADAQAVKQDRERQQRFLAKVCNTDDQSEPLWIAPFCTREDLTNQVLADVSVWQNTFLHDRKIRAQEQTAFYESRLQQRAETLHAIGSIGRSQHFSLAEATHEALIAGSGGKKAPGLCLLVYGRKGYGQSPFVRLLSHKAFWKFENETRFFMEKRLAQAETMIWWRLWEAIGQDPVGEPNDTEALADRAAVTCADRPVFLLIENVHYFDQGVKGFADRVWTPLYKSLQKAWAKQKPEHHVFIFLTSETGGGKPPKDVAWQGSIVGKNVDHGRVLPLPELEALTEGQVEEWLRPMMSSRRERWLIASHVIGEGHPEDIFKALMKSNVRFSQGSLAL